MDDTPIRPAATLVLARAAAPGFEVFLSRRTSKAAFMANAYVYPGGRVDEADHDPAYLARLLPRDPDWFAREFEDGLGPDAGRAHYVAALRESFEEAGVLYARRADGTELDLSDAATSERMAVHRAALNRGERDLLSILIEEDLVLDATGLDYFAHWITPPFETRRFDTRFFFAALPAGQTPVPDRSELVDGGWYTAAAALRAYEAGQVRLAPPTLCTLDDMSRCDDLDAARAWAAAEVPTPILPRLEQVDGDTALLLPGDPLYPSETPVRGPTRVVHRAGRFSRE